MNKKSIIFLISITIILKPIFSNNYYVDINYGISFYPHDQQTYLNQNNKLYKINQGKNNILLTSLFTDLLKKRFYSGVVFGIKHNPTEFYREDYSNNTLSYREYKISSVSQLLLFKFNINLFSKKRNIGISPGINAGISKNIKTLEWEKNYSTGIVTEFRTESSRTTVKDIINNYNSNPIVFLPELVFFYHIRKRVNINTRLLQYYIPEKPLFTSYSFLVGIQYSFL